MRYKVHIRPDLVKGPEIYSLWIIRYNSRMEETEIGFFTEGELSWRSKKESSWDLGPPTLTVPVQILLAFGLELSNHDIINRELRIGDKEINALKDHLGDLKKILFETGKISWER